MKVSELIELLQSMPQDKEVFTEGCDCEGDVGGVAIDEEDVLIYRTNGDWVYAHKRESNHGS